MTTREEMVDDQLRARGIGDERVLAAMGSVPRERFLPKRQADQAYRDGALPIGHGQTLSQPWIVAAICQGLELRGNETVLEVGTGSGYSAAVLARLARRVVSVELIGELARAARARLRELRAANVEVREGDGGADLGDERFEAIAVHAAVPSLPPALVTALAEGGRLVAPVAIGGGDRGEVLCQFRRVGVDGEGRISLESSEISPVRFVEMRGVAGFDGP